MKDVRVLTGLSLFNRDGIVTRAIESGVFAGEPLQSETLRHLHQRAQEMGVEAAVLLALAGLDGRATAFARYESPTLRRSVAHALSKVGPHGVQPSIAMALASVMDDNSVVAGSGPCIGASVSWWQSEITVWTPNTDSVCFGHSGVGITTSGVLHVPAILPETLYASLAGRHLSALVRHRMILDDLVIESATRVTDGTQVSLREQAA